MLTKGGRSVLVQVKQIMDDAVSVFEIMDNKQKSWPGILSMLLYNTVVISPDMCQYHYLVI